MNKIKIFILLLFLLLISCDEKKDEAYLLEHPTALKQAIEACQTNSDKSLSEENKCKIIMRTAMNFNAIMQKQQEDPEKFGEHILTAQSAIVILQQKLIDAEKKLIDLQSKHPSPDELTAAQRQFDEVKQAYQAQAKEIKIWLAIIGMNTPE